MTRLVLAIAGTDHHPFARLVQWVDAAASLHRDVHFVMQHGASPSPTVAEGHAFLTHDDLVAMLREASAVVCHGGPGSILDSREAGHVPLCVPRDPLLGEHVDGHQQRFAAAVAGAGVVRAISSLKTFHHALSETLAAPARGAAFGGQALVRDAARARVAAELDSVMRVRPRRMALHRVSH